MNISDSLKNNLLSATEKQLVLYFENGTVLSGDDIVSETMTLEQTMCDEEELTYGLCNASSFKINIYNKNVSYKDKWFTPVFVYGNVPQSLPSGSDSVRLGRFKVVEDKLSDSRLERSLTCYDKMYDLQNTDISDWYNTATFPMTISALRELLRSNCGYQSQQVVLVNDILSVNRTVDTTEGGLTAKKLLSAICEINGVFGFFNGFGELVFKSIANPSDSAIEVVDASTCVYAQSVVYEDFKTEVISKLKISESDDDVGTVIGVGGNAYVLSANFLLFGNDADTNAAAGQRLMPKINTLSYQPCRLRMRGMPWVELGDYVRTTFNGITLDVLVLRRTLDGITGLTDTIEAKGVRVRGLKVDTIRDQLKQLGSRTLKIKQDVSQYSITLTNITNTLEEHESKFEMTDQQILLMVRKDNIISSINISEENITINAEKIDLQGYVTFTNLSTEGETNINGSNIYTGRIHSQDDTFIIDLDNKQFITEDDAVGYGLGIYGNSIRFLKNGTEFGHILGAESSDNSRDEIEIDVDNLRLTVEDIYVQSAENSGEWLKGATGNFIIPNYEVFTEYNIPAFQRNTEGASRFLFKLIPVLSSIRQNVTIPGTSTVASLLYEYGLAVGVSYWDNYSGINVFDNYETETDGEGYTIASNFSAVQALASDFAKSPAELGEDLGFHTAFVKEPFDYEAGFQINHIKGLITSLDEVISDGVSWEKKTNEPPQASLEGDESHYLLTVPIVRHSDDNETITVKCELCCAYYDNSYFYYKTNSQEPYVVDTKTLTIKNFGVYSFDFLVDDIIQWAQNANVNINNSMGRNVCFVLKCDIISTSDESAYAPYDDPGMYKSGSGDNWTASVYGHTNYQYRCFLFNVSSYTSGGVVTKRINSANDTCTNVRNAEDPRIYLSMSGGVPCDIGLGYNFTRVIPPCMIPVKMKWVVSTSFRGNLSDVVDYAVFESMTYYNWSSSNGRPQAKSSISLYDKLYSGSPGSLFGAPFSYNPDGATGYIKITHWGFATNNGATHSPDNAMYRYADGIYITRGGVVVRYAASVDAESNSMLFGASNAISKPSEKKTYTRGFIDVWSYKRDEYYISTGCMVKNPYIGTSRDLYGTPYEIVWSVSWDSGDPQIELEHLYKVSPDFASDIGESSYYSSTAKREEVQEIDTGAGFYGGRIISSNGVYDGSQTLQ